MATLELRGLSKWFPSGERAVDGVDLTVTDGERVVIVGPSGSGKSTLLRMVAGLEQPTLGDVLIDAERVNDVSPQRRDVAMTFQSGALYPHMTVAENLGFPLRAAGLGHREIARLVADVAALLHVDDVLDATPRRLSGGQRQRVAMGRSIIRRPRLFLLDEPLANLDTKLRVEMRSAIVRLQQHLGVTMLFVTHDQVEAMAMADRLAVMRAGRIVQVGTPAEVYHHPHDLFVGTFLGSPPMGVVVATAESNGGAGGSVRIGHQRIPWPGLRVDGRVLVGMRPEALRLDADGPLAGSPVALEDIGHEQVLSIALPAGLGTGDGHLVLDAGRSRDGDAIVHLVVGPGAMPDTWRPVRISVDVGLLHLFDACSGAAIDAGGPGTGVVGRPVHH
jgi:ABC-type sugar transport system ATPase subunit